MTPGHILFHIPVCPFSQRVEILLALRGATDLVEFRVVDVTKPRDPALLEKTRGSTVFPVLETPQGQIIRESLVILRYLDELIAGPQLRKSEAHEHAIESMLVAYEGPLTMAGYLFVMNQDQGRRDEHRDKLLALYKEINDFLVAQNPDGLWLFGEFGLAEAVFTPLFKRFWFLEYYEGFRLPDGPEFARVVRWIDACIAHPATDQVSQEEIVKLYYDYALGTGNGALVDGRKVSSFAPDPAWQSRPWPPKDKYRGTVSDRALGLAD